MNRLSAGSAQVATQSFYPLDWLRPSAIGLTILLAILCIFVLSPIYLLITSAAPVEGSQVGNSILAPWRAAFNEPGIGKAFANTLIVTTLVQGISIPIAILIAWVIARTDMPGARFAELLFWIT